MTENTLVTKDHFADLRTQLIKIKEENSKIVFDYEKEDKAARSHVHSLRKSKTAISDLHKEKKKFFLEEGRKIDAAKNELIADVEEMIEVHAKPLQEIKDRKDAEIEAERKKVEMELDWDAAMAENDLFNREREMNRKEEAHEKAEAERLAKEKAEQDEKDRIAYEAKVKADAEEKAKKDAEEALLKEQQEKERLIQEAKQREEQANVDAENAEKKRLADIEAEKQRAEQDKKDALAAQKAEQDKKDKAEANRLAEEKRIEDARIADVEHRRAINASAKEAIIHICKIPASDAQNVVEQIAMRNIKNISINY